MDLINKKEELKKQLEEEIANWETKMDELKVLIKPSSIEIKKILQPQLDKLELEFEKTKKKLQKLDEAAEHALDDQKNGTNSSNITLKEAFKNASEHFKHRR